MTINNIEDEIAKAKAGSLESQYNVGAYYVQNSQGNPKGIDEGIHWLRLAATQGHTKSKIALKSIAIQLQSMGMTPDSRFDIVKNFRSGGGCFGLILITFIPAFIYMTGKYFFEPL